MNKYAYALVPVTMLLFAGCATNNSTERIGSTPSNEVIELKKALADANTRIDELNNKFLLLKERLEGTKTHAEPAVVEDEPVEPKGLKVVKLDSGGDVPEENEAPAKKPASKKPGTKAAASSELDTEALYNKGQNHFMAGNYDTAREIFDGIAKNTPTSSFADNALYWIAESYYAEHNYAAALSMFKETYEKYPKENKAPDAMLKAALSHKELGNLDASAETLELLITRYPDSPAADKAKRTVKKISHSN